MIYFIAIAVYGFVFWLGFSFGKQAGLAEARMLCDKLLRQRRGEPYVS